MSAIALSRSFRLNIEEAFNHIGRDPRWAGKLGLGALFSLLSIVFVGSILVQGYLLAFIRRVARAEPLPLPEWDNWGELLRKGLIVWVVNLIYYLPYVLLFVLLYAGQVSFSLLPLFLPGSSQGGAGGPPPALFIGSFALVLVGYGFLLLLGLVISAFLPAVHAQLALHDADFGSAFRIGEIFAFIGRYRGQYALAVGLTLAATYSLSFFGQLACCIGVYVTNNLCQLFLAHLLGQLCWHERQRGTEYG